MEYEVVFYETGSGSSPVLEFIESLDKKTQGKIAARIGLLETHGPNLLRPYADIVKGKIRELRIEYSSNEYRIFYFFFHRNQIVLLHGVKKKSQKLDPNDIETATRRMESWIESN